MGWAGLSVEETAAPWKLSVFVINSCTGRRGYCIQVNKQESVANLSRSSLQKGQVSCCEDPGESYCGLTPPHTHTHNVSICTLTWERPGHPSEPCLGKALPLPWGWVTGVHDGAMHKSTAHNHSEFHSSLHPWAVVSFDTHSEEDALWPN